MTGNEDEGQIFAAYGSVMLLVQYWENSLTLVWLRVARKERVRPAGDFDSQASQKEIRRLEAAFQRMTVQAVAKDVAPHLDTDTAEALPALMKARDNFAHRFLFEHHDQENGGFKNGTMAALAELGERFETSTNSVMETVMSFPEYNGPVLPGWPELAERLTKRVFSGERLPRDPKDQ